MADRLDPSFALTALVTREGPVAVIRLRGALDMTGAPTVRECVGEVIDDGCKEVVIDIEKLTFLDSSGLMVLYSAHRQLEASGGRFVLRRPTSRERRLIAVTGMDEVFHIED
jgi:anti-sigma B factor antagonist